MCAYSRGARRVDCVDDGQVSGLFAWNSTVPWKALQGVIRAAHGACMEMCRRPTYFLARPGCFLALNPHSRRALYIRTRLRVYMRARDCFLMELIDILHSIPGCDHNVDGRPCAANRTSSKPVTRHPRSSRASCTYLIPRHSFAGRPFLITVSPLSMFITFHNRAHTVTSGATSSLSGSSCRRTALPTCRPWSRTLTKCSQAERAQSKRR